MRWSSEFFQVPQPGRKFERGNFPSPRAQKEPRAQNFFKSQGPYRYGSAKSNTTTYFFILFLHIFDIFFRIFYIFLHVFYIFLHIFHIFLHIYKIKEFPNVTSSREGGVLANPEITPNLKIFPSPPDIFPPNVTSSGGGVYSLILTLPSGA